MSYGGSQYGGTGYGGVEDSATPPAPVDVPPVPDPPNAVMLGSGDYRCFLASRGGESVLAELPWSSIRYARKVDDSTSAVVTCASAPNWLRAWAHELTIFRNERLAWCGPVQPPTWDENADSPNVTIQAGDVFTWFDVRCLEHDREWTDEDLAIIFTQAAADALARDPGPNVQVATALTGVLGDRKVVGAQMTKAGDFMRELARSGLDFTVLGRRVICGGAQVPDLLPFTLTNDTLLSPRVQGAAETGSEAIVLGGNSGAQTQPILGRAGGIDPEIGLVQRVYNESTILDQFSADSAALTHFQHLASEPLLVTGVLGPRLRVDYQDLVGGRKVITQIEAEDKVVNALLRMQQMETSVTVDDQGQTEEHAVTLIPLGTDQDSAAA